MTKSVIFLIIVTLLTACTGRRPSSREMLQQADRPLTSATITESSPLWHSNPLPIWIRLQTLSPKELRTTENTVQSTIGRGWMDLAIISKEYSTNDTRLITALLDWKRHFPEHPGNQLMPDAYALQQLLHPNIPAQFALLLPTQGASAHASKAIKSGFFSAYYSALKKTPDLKSIIRLYDTSDETSIEELYQQALKNGADQIIGPLRRDSVQALSRVMQPSPPVLALNYISTGYFSKAPTLVQFGLAPEDEAIQLAAHARSRGFAHALLIAPDDAWGKRVGRALQEAWGVAGGQLKDSLYYADRSHLAEKITALLKVKTLSEQEASALLPEEHRRQDIDVIFLLAPAADGRQIVPLLKYNYLTDLPIYSISSIYTGSPQPTADLDLDGVIFCDIPSIIGSNIPQARLNALGHDAFALATRMQRLKALPHFPIQGMTGALTLEEPSNRIFRTLSWMQMRNGRPQPYNP